LEKLILKRIAQYSCWQEKKTVLFGFKQDPGTTGDFWKVKIIKIRI
jgi:hypothetical protein